MEKTMQRRVTVFTRAAGWLGLPRLFKAIHDNGFAVDLICVEGSFAMNSSYLARVLTLREDDPDQAWVEGLLDFESEYLLLGDDVAVDWLVRTGARNSRLADFLNTRSYNLEKMEQTRNKYTLAGLAAVLGIPVPPVTRLSEGVDTETLVADLGSPFVLKSALGFAGNEVFICRHASEIHQVRDILQKSPDAFAQRYIPGKALMVAVACRKGQVLSRFAAVKRSTWPPITGPSTIVEIADHPIACDYVDTLVAALGLSGLISFDFIIDALQHYWLMECNLRPVPVSHYGGVLVDAWLNNRTSALPEGSNGLLALYPQALLYPIDMSSYKLAVLDDQVDDQPLHMAYKQQISMANAQYTESKKAALSAQAPQRTSV
jgi:predicted ATP-grasp superfamily ATP-dependent carboligase